MSSISRLRGIDTEKKRHRLHERISVPLDVLEFPFSRPLDPAHVERLTAMFGGGRCLPQKDEYRIPAIVNRDALKEEWFEERAGTKYLNPPAEFRLPCLRGQHRVKAAQNLLSGEKRWVIDIYDSSIGDDARIDLIENYDSEKPPDDGEFYYKVRLYLGAFGSENADTALEKRWRARWNSLPKKRTKDHRNQDHLERLLGHPRYVTALDGFQHLKVLYSGLWLGSIGRMISLGCDEELVSELRRLKSFWYKVFDNNESDMDSFDRNSLERLQRTAPGASKRQRTKLESEVIAGYIFGTFSLDDRIRLFRNLCAATKEMMVPSLDSFFRNLSYREVLRNCMMRLVNPGGESLRSALAECFVLPTEQSYCLVQIDSDHLVRVQAKDDHFDIAYRQLWLFVIRHYDSMSPILKPRKAGPRGDPADKRIVFEFARLAYEIGFRTPSISKLLAKDPDREIARQMLQAARKPNRYSYPDLERAISQAMSPIYTAVLDLQGQDAIDPPEKDQAPHLFGKPRVEHFEQDRNMMFLTRLHSPLEDQRDCLSSFFVARSHYFSFLGDSIRTEFTGLEHLERIPLYSIDKGSFAEACELSGTYRSEPQYQLQELTSKEAELNQRERELENARLYLQQQENNLEEARRAHEEDLENVELGKEEMRQVQGHLEVQEAEIQRRERGLQEAWQVEQSLESTIHDLQERKRQLEIEIQILEEVVRSRNTESRQKEYHEDPKGKERTVLQESESFQAEEPQPQYGNGPSYAVQEGEQRIDEGQTHRAQAETCSNLSFPLDTDEETEQGVGTSAPNHSQTETVHSYKVRFFNEDGKLTKEFPMNSKEEAWNYAVDAQRRACMLWHYDPKHKLHKEVKADQCYNRILQDFAQGNDSVFTVANKHLDTRKLPSYSVLQKGVKRKIIADGPETVEIRKSLTPHHQRSGTSKRQKKELDQKSEA